ncbi:class I SAM-dependent methyltransferase [Promicromonospora sp. NPDC059942]|uniref:class I SAM-dependent methyltransferase n=1 Tax=Promicromonospora sp. NPDC059942 TaxID=3347009 RepID=UPI0036647871
MAFHAHQLDTQALLPQLLELDAEVHAGLMENALDVVANRARAHEVRSVLDAGAGTGAATFQLAGRFPDAQVVAVDTDPAMTRLVQARAATEGADQVVAATRDILSPGLAPDSVDLVWSSSVFHELKDPDAVLTGLFGLLRPGGVLAVIEMDTSPRLLPDGYAELESRLRQSAGADLPSPDWTTSIRLAGFDLETVRVLTSDQDLPADGPGGAYARLELQRLALHAGHRLSDADRSVLTALYTGQSPETFPARVRLRGARTLWVARRP